MEPSLEKPFIRLATAGVGTVVLGLIAWSADWGPRGPSSLFELFCLLGVPVCGVWTVVFFIRYRRAVKQRRENQVQRPSGPGGVD